ncbi:MAG: helix-turn-helix domain-containing protein [Planctomycetes bacterium]|nr:helix-turn-helix domain-containing protein [Planctomycetota bacterium]
MTNAAETFNELLDSVCPTLSYARVGERCQVSGRTIYHLASGKIGRPTRGTVALIARALRVPADRVRAAIAASHQLRGE